MFELSAPFADSSAVSQRHHRTAAQTGSEFRFANRTTPQTSSRDQVSSVVTAHQLVPTAPSLASVNSTRSAVS